MKNFLIYLYCCWINKATFLGLISLFITVYTIVFSVLNGINFWLVICIWIFGLFGLLLLVVTSFGGTTFKMYRACLRLKSPEKVARYMSFLNKDYRDYCNQVAILSAEKRLKRNSVFLYLYQARYCL